MLSAISFSFDQSKIMQMAAVFVDNQWGGGGGGAAFPSFFLRNLGNRKSTLYSLQDSINMLPILQWANGVLSNHMNIYQKGRFASQFSQGKCM